MRWPPHLVQYCRSLCGVLAKVPINSRPCVTFTSSGAHSVKALTGPADQERHDPQWQYPITFGEPVASSFTAPQKHSPFMVQPILPRLMNATQLTAFAGDGQPFSSCNLRKPNYPVH